MLGEKKRKTGRKKTKKKIGKCTNKQRAVLHHLFLSPLRGGDSSDFLFSGKHITEDSHLFQLPPGSRENRASRARLRAVNRRTHRVLRTKRRGVALPACKPADSRFSTNRDNIIIV